VFSFRNSSTVQLQNSIIVNATDVGGAGTFTSLGYDIIGSTTGANYTSGTGDQIGAAPVLDALGNYGGPTQTMLPASTSPAVNVIPPASCPITTDQRGDPRPGAGFTNCTIGAVERQTGDVAP
jgi:hypothetical protein